MLMNRMILLMLAFLAGLILVGCDAVTGEDDDSSSDKKDNGTTPLILTGTSGNDVNMNGTWSRGCTGSGPFSDTEFIFDGTQFTGNNLEWLSGTGCVGGNDISTTVAGLAVRDQAVAGYTWVDANGGGSTAPAGLENTTDVNGMTTTMTSAQATPETQAGADALNGKVECGLTDWAVGVTKDVLDCFLGGGDAESKDTWLVDDTTSTTTTTQYGAPDEPTAFDATGYPTQIENFDPLVRTE